MKISSTSAEPQEEAREEGSFDNDAIENPSDNDTTKTVAKKKKHFLSWLSTDQEPSSQEQQQQLQLQPPDQELQEPQEKRTPASPKKSEDGPQHASVVSPRASPPRSPPEPTTQPKQSMFFRSTPTKKKKEFGETVSIQKPDLQSMMDVGAIRRNDLGSGDDQDGDHSRETQQGRRCSALIPELPSHVPTPQTIQAYDEPWSNKVEDALQTITTIFSAGESSHYHHHNNTHTHSPKPGESPLPRKYAPSVITPPQSPVSTRSKKVIAAPQSWGKDFWSSQMHRTSPVVGSTIARSPSGTDDDPSMMNLSNHLLSPTSRNYLGIHDDEGASDVPAPRKSPSRSVGKSLLSKKTKKKTSAGLGGGSSHGPKHEVMSPMSSSSHHGGEVSPFLTQRMKPPSPLQLQWMQHNVLNLQVARDDDESSYDGETTKDEEVTFAETPLVARLPKPSESNASLPKRAYSPSSTIDTNLLAKKTASQNLLAMTLSSRGFSRANEDRKEYDEDEDEDEELQSSEPDENSSTSPQETEKEKSTETEEEASPVVTMKKRKSFPPLQQKWMKNNAVNLRTTGLDSDEEDCAKDNEKSSFFLFRRKSKTSK